MFYKDTFADLIRERKRLRPWRRDLSRLRNTRRDRFARRYAADVIARRWQRACNRDEAWLGAARRKNPRVSAPEAAGNDSKSPDGSRRGSCVWACVRVSERRTRRRDATRRSFEANAFLCRDLAARAKHPALSPARSLATAFRIELPTLSLDTAPNVPRETFLYWFRSRGDPRAVDYPRLSLSLSLSLCSSLW